MCLKQDIRTGHRSGKTSETETFWIQELIKHHLHDRAHQSGTELSSAEQCPGAGLNVDIVQLVAIYYSNRTNRWPIRVTNESGSSKGDVEDLGVPRR
jgi:hypothetical protein